MCNSSDLDGVYAAFSLVSLVHGRSESILRIAVGFLRSNLFPFSHAGIQVEKYVAEHFLLVALYLSLFRVMFLSWLTCHSLLFYLEQEDKEQFLSSVFMAAILYILS